MIITVTGFPGSGKSTVGKKLAKKLKFKYYSIGDLWRKLAFQRGMTLEELEKFAQKDFSVDKEADDYIKLLAKEEDDFVLDGRMGYLFIPNSVKICVIVTFEEGANRIWKDLEESEERNEAHYKNYEETLAGIKNRVKCDIRRYKKYYGVENCFDKDQFDLIIDSTNMPVEKVVDKAYEFIQKKKKQ